MPNRYYTAFKSLKISAKGARPSNPSGTTAAMPQKQGFCSSALPGKASNAFAKAKAGIKEVNGYANYEGLSSGKKANCDSGMEMDEMKSMKSKKKAY